MAKVDEIKQYFKKLQRVVNTAGEFTFFDIKLIKKDKIDDVLCCLLAVLPDEYKRAMKQINDEQKRLDSIICYNTLFNSIKRKFPLNNSVYLVEYVKASRLINTICKCIEKDIEFLEKQK